MNFKINDSFNVILNISMWKKLKRVGSRQYSQPSIHLLSNKKTYNQANSFICRHCINNEQAQLSGCFSSYLLNVLCAKLFVNIKYVIYIYK